MRRSRSVMNTPNYCKSLRCNTTLAISSKHSTTTQQHRRSDDTAPNGAGSIERPFLQRYRALALQPTEQAPEVRYICRVSAANRLRSVRSDIFSTDPMMPSPTGLADDLIGWFYKDVAP